MTTEKLPVPAFIGVTTGISLASYFNEQASKRRNTHVVTAHVSSAGKVTIQIAPQGGDGSETLTFVVEGNQCQPSTQL